MGRQEVIEELKSISNIIFESQQGCSRDYGKFDLALEKINIHVRYLMAIIDDEKLASSVEFAVGTGNINTG